MSSLLTLAERVRSELRARGLRVGLPQGFGACVELPIDHGDSVVYVYIYPGRFSEALVAKITPTRCGCERALLCPYGLYALAEPEALSRAIQAKLRRASIIAKMVREESINL